jgi:hypothetical protein
MPSTSTNPSTIYRRLERIGAERTAARETVTRGEQQVLAEVTDALRRGVPLNVSECARAAGVTRAFLYKWLPEDARRRLVDADRQAA